MKKLCALIMLLLISGAGAQAQQTAPVPPAAPGASPTPTASPLPTTVVESHSAEGVRADTPAVTRGGVTLPPEKANPVTLPRFDKAPVIDGKLDDEIWQRAVLLKDFYQINPGDNIAPSHKTEVLIGFDAKFLYVAFRAFDEPGGVRATVAKRDNIFNDDYVGFFLDTFNDQRKAFIMFFNPLGIQGDGVLTEGRGEDYSVDVLMDSKGLVTETGFTVEIAIPFKSIRYEAGKGKQWGVHFFRRIKRLNNELDSWMPFSRSISGNLNQAGHLTGLEGIAVERTIELIPSLTVSETGKFVRSFNPLPGVPDPGRIVNEPVTLEPGLTAKFNPSPAITLDLALNPDFAQVEADQLVVTANQRFPIFFPEKRPFFLEGIDIFRTPIQAVHTRAIVDPDIAIKLTGKTGRNTFGVMVASDNGPGNFVGDERLNPNNFAFIDRNAYIGVLRLKRDIGRENSLGLIATTYNFIRKHNDLFGFDGRFKLNPKTTLNFQVLGTTSRNTYFDPSTGRSRYRTGNGLGYSANYNISGRNWGMELFAEGFSPDYRADVGFFGRVNSNFNAIFLRYNSNPQPKNFIIGYHLHNFTHIDYNWQGKMYAWESEFLVELNLPRNSYLGVGYEKAYERLFEEEFGARRRNVPCDPYGTSGLRPCTFYGESDERSSGKHHFFIFGSSNYSKKLQFNFRGVMRLGHLDLDLGNGSKYPRVSPAALLNPRAPLDPGAGDLIEINGGITYQPTDALRTSLNLVKQRLVRHDTGRTAFDINILTFRATYQFTKATFARTIIDYNTLNSRARAQFLAGWTPSPGTAFYVGYNDDLNYNSQNPLTREIVPGFRRNTRTFFIKMSYLFRKSF